MPTPKRKKVQDHFDNPRQVSERGGPAPGDMELIARRDKFAAERETKPKSRTEQRKQVLDFIRKHSGLTKNAIREAHGSVAGIDEWLRDGVLVQRNFGIYLS